MRVRQHNKGNLGASGARIVKDSCYVWTCLVKAKQPKKDNVLFVFNVDCKSRLDPPIPAAYCGNCVADQKVMAVTKDLAGNDVFISALEGIDEAVNRVRDGVLSGAETWVSDTHGTVEAGMLAVGGSPRFEVYSTDFGWGRPKKVDMTSIDRIGAFSLSESRDNSGGIEIGLMLGKRVMEAFTTLFV
ncbi:Anthocyanin 5-aromatic acyltransferase [Spatholobus suberectus]|nr:Anthocyanin 5-aromatic acyltransferase [Spatholobus suberectus]